MMEYYGVLQEGFLQLLAYRGPSDEVTGDTEDCSPGQLCPNAIHKLPNPQHNPTNEF